jgi:hypothetical protein
MELFDFIAIFAIVGSRIRFGAHRPSADHRVWRANRQVVSRRTPRLRALRRRVPPPVMGVVVLFSVAHLSRLHARSFRRARSNGTPRLST